MLDMPTLKSGLGAVLRPIAEANGLPSALYTAPEALELERQHIFHAGWSVVGFAHDVPRNGDAKPIDFIGAPLLLLRDHAGEVRLYHNVCRHRGMILVEEPRNFGGVIRCPYHSWCYSLDGRLRATPHVGGPGINTHASVDPDTTGLIPVALAVFMGLVFANVSGTAPPFDDYIAPLRHRWAEFVDQPLFPAATHGGFTLDIRANWKLILENNCESYHLPWVHPGLNSYSRLEDHYHIEEPSSFSGQGTLVYNPKLHDTMRLPDFAGLCAKWDRGAEYASFYPNVLLGVHRDHYWAAHLDPRAHDHTLERVEIFYSTQETAESPEYEPLRAENARLWKEVLSEDIFVTQGMQRGRSAPEFDGGVFSEVMDSPTHCFHTWVADRLRG